MTFNAAANYFHNLKQLRNADPLVFTHEYPRIAHKSVGRQPILVNSLGQPLDGYPGPRQFIGEPFFYRDHYYASVNEEFPFVALSLRLNENGLAMPMCFHRKPKTMTATNLQNGQEFLYTFHKKHN